MLLIYSPTRTNRLEYILQLTLSEILGVTWELTADREKYLSFPGPKLAYAPDPLPGGLFIEASGLLFEQNIIPQDLKVNYKHDLPVIFTSENPSSALPFDPFAAAFYMVTRYEEYFSHHTDRYGRFLVTDSIASKGKFLDRPIVHEWLQKLALCLKKNFPVVEMKPRSYRYVPTIDIDHAYAYCYRPLVRTLGGIGRSLAHGHFQDLIQRIKVLSGRYPDPYSNYTYLRGVHDPLGHRVLYFILFADYGGSDNNIPVTHDAFHRLLRELDRDGSVGIHPSFSSNKHPDRLESEYSGLCQVLGRDVTLSRQHFLKISIPKTYQHLIHLGIKEDFSMGYASHSGFRAGLAIPFPFFDLSKNEIGPLTIHPVTVMDVTLKDYLRLSTEKSLEKIESMITTIKSVNGEFVSLWHNESLGETGRWKGWRRVYEEMVRMASS
ncbi:MAG: polysaccharide deacetylase family protein [Bacteroidales bacterium]|jgi:hypothetical protein|nr:polysaccharide deacetylase family protein [Bacteroidales bacterium]